MKGENPHSQVQGVEEEHQVFPLEVIQAQLLELSVNNGRSLEERGVLRDRRGQPRAACGQNTRAAGRAGPGPGAAAASSPAQPHGQPGPRGRRGRSRRLPPWGCMCLRSRRPPRTYPG